VSIEISARLDGGSLLVIVRNTGSTLAHDYRDGVGLRNCRERLNVIYGPAANLQMLSEHDAVMAKVMLPLQARTS
jgi:LytS/YehU family sensor histidine kinase